MQLFSFLVCRFFFLEIEKVWQVCAGNQATTGGELLRRLSIATDQCGEVKPVIDPAAHCSHPGAQKHACAQFHFGTIE